jgi:NADPH2:quinone reductase
VNFADIQRRRGGYRGAAPPFVPGLDVTGTIAAVGEGVHELRAGQRVAAFPVDGGYAEVVRARAVLTYPLDDAIPEEAAASLVVLVTAYNLLTMVTRLRQGESILIHAAAGGVGSTAVQMARALGAGRIVGTAGGAEKVRIAREAGADVVIDYTSEDLAAAVRGATAEKGVDVILDAVAGDVFAQSLPVLAPFGRYCIYGMASGKPGEVKSNELHMSNRAVLGYSSNGYRDARPEALRDGVRGAYELVAKGAVKILVGARYALCDAAEAHRHVESRASHGKVLLTP